MTKHHFMSQPPTYHERVYKLSIRMQQCWQHVSDTPCSLSTVNSNYGSMVMAVDLSARKLGFNYHRDLAT